MADIVRRRCRRRTHQRIRRCRRSCRRNRACTDSWRWYHRWNQTLRRGRDEVRADQQKNHVGRFESSVNLAIPLGARRNLPVVPHGDEALTPKQRKVRLKFVAKLLVLV